MAAARARWTGWRVSRDLDGQQTVRGDGIMPRESDDDGNMPTDAGTVVSPRDIARTVMGEGYPIQEHHDLTR
jgi:hypothetical protein